MHPDLVKLLELQVRDRALLDADHELSAILAEVEALDQQLTDQEAAVTRARAQVADATHRRQEIDLKLENYRKLEERGRQHLEQVRTPKEMQAVNVELDLARSILAKEEAEWIRVAEQIANAEAQVQEGEKRFGMLQEAQVTARTEIAGRQAAAVERRQVALTARAGVAAAVEQSLRIRYERLRRVKSVTVVVALSGAACGSCHTTVPLNRRSQMRAGMLIDSCESCGVILYAGDDVA